MDKLDQLRERIETKKAKIAVIGLGYVGLPQAVMFADLGFQVVGIDICEKRVTDINAMYWPLDPQEPELPVAMQSTVVLGKLRATTDYAACHDADAVIVAVPTPVDENRRPDYKALTDALMWAAASISKPILMCIESTLAPGSMADIATMLPDTTLLAYCPERVTPGILAHNLRQVPRVIGADSEAAILAMALYSQICKASLYVTDPLSAEICKCAENAYRDVQLAFANELALICEDLGADVWQVRQLINTCPGRYVLRPGPGVGGACIPKDPWLLMSDLSIEADLLTAARATNDWMPHHVADLTMEALQEAKTSTSGAQVVILGVAYKENTSDTRNSPALAVMERLIKAGCDVCFYDPFVDGYDGDLLTMLTGADAAVICTGHDDFYGIDWQQVGQVMCHKVLVDARSVAWPAPRGFVYRGLGRGGK